MTAQKNAALTERACSSMVKLKIEKLVYGGDGLARTENGVVFVPAAAAGDVVEAEIVATKKDYASARILRLLEPSPDRREPTCPNYATEGCCHWEHIKYESQVDYKVAIISESLKRLGHVPWERPVKRITGPDHHYRLRATFHVFNGHLGFVHGPIRECASLVPELNHFIPTVDASGAREVQALSAPEVVASFRMLDGSIQRSGRATLYVDGSLRYGVTADTFFQANRFLLRQFIGEVIEQAGPAPRRVLELYSGAGFFSIPLARVAKEVIAIESSRTAVRQARENATANEAGSVRFVEGEVDSILKQSELEPDLVVLDPPRAGCGPKTAEQIANLRPERIIYISCNPTTFAREAAVFSARGYQLTRLTLIDQFPNTYHIETIASFDRR